MCGSLTNEVTWEEIVRLYRLTVDAPPHNASFQLSTAAPRNLMSSATISVT